ncbi:MAG: acyl-CoA thioesterase [Acidobacteria bacterium]|nr:acyl-CoA thioesterase [Acidobacteriota bacterium]
MNSEDVQFPGYVDFPLRVRYAETDQMRVAYYASYLVWFEVGRSEFCRSRGFTYDEMEREKETYFMVVESFCRYRAPLRYDMEFIVRTRLSECHTRLIKFAYELRDCSQSVVYADGFTKHLVVNGEGRPARMPAKYYTLLSGR